MRKAFLTVSFLVALGWPLASSAQETEDPTFEEPSVEDPSLEDEAPLTVPLTGNYGSDLACKLYDDGGTEAVMSNGDTFTPPKPDAANPFLIVRPDGVDGYDLTCEIYDSTDLKAGGWVVTLFCSEDGDEAGDITSVRIVEDTAKGTISYADGRRSITLKRCD